MRSEISVTENVASKSTDTATDRNVSDDEECWFSNTSSALLGPGAGTTLHYITGFDERSCYRYANGSVRPPGYFIRALLRSEQGATWLNGIMDGCEARWWREHNSIAAKAALLDHLRAEIERRLGEK